MEDVILSRLSVCVVYEFNSHSLSRGKFPLCHVPCALRLNPICDLKSPLADLGLLQGFMGYISPQPGKQCEEVTALAQSFELWFSSLGFV